MVFLKPYEQTLFFFFFFFGSILDRLGCYPFYRQAQLAWRDRGRLAIGGTGACWGAAFNGPRVPPHIYPHGQRGGNLEAYLSKAGFEIQPRIASHLPFRIRETSLITCVQQSCPRRMGLQGPAKDPHKEMGGSGIRTGDLCFQSRQC